MPIRTFLVAANAVLLLALIAQLGFHVGDTESRTYLMASWKDRPQSLEATTELAESVVHGRVQRVRKAAPIVHEAPGEPGDKVEIPVEVVTIRLVDDAVKGRRGKGTTLELFHTGHSDARSPAARAEPRGRPPEKPEDAVEKADAEQSEETDMAVVFSSLMNDPGYKAGEEYMLFVREGPTLRVEGRPVKTMGIISPEGRYLVRDDETVVPMSPRDFAQQLRGKPVRELKQRAAQAAGRGRGRPEG